MTKLLDPPPKTVASRLDQWRQDLASPPRYRIEESIALRILVQLLVIVGIIATDVAATDVTEWAITSYWAIPLSIAGATWSWHRRHKRNVMTKFALAVGMLLMLAAFFARLIGELNDTRLALALLLIQLQVLHSFDLPRRQDLGYSMVIGLILLGVAGTLSQTLAFAPILFVFITIALPVLVLDYSSRLGLTPRLWRNGKLQLSTALSPRRLGVFLLVIVALGLTIFAFLPRFPGYQLRTFPVSSPVEFQGEFDGRRIVNPGYVREGRQTGNGGVETGGEGTGQNSPSRGPGKLDDKFYYGFSQQMNQNLRGTMKPEVVLRVRSQAEGYWRVLGFDRYTGQGWEISRNEQAQTINRPDWTYQFFLPRLPVANQTREIVQTYTVVSELPNLIPAMPWAKELYFPTKQVAIDAEGSLRSPLELIEGFTYTVVSEVPYRNRTVLRQASEIYPPSIRGPYLQLPSEIAPKIRQKTEEILAKSPNSLDSPYEKALYLAQYLKQHYTINPGLEFFGANEDMVEAFLFKFEGGYPDHFSTTLTVMLRSIGIPARLAVGFGTGQFNPFTGLYIVKNTDAYAITEVYFPRYGWFGFDPIPGHELIPPSIEEDQTFGVLKTFWQWIAGWLPLPLKGFLNTLFEFVGRFLARLIGWALGLFAQGWVGLFTGLIALTCLAFVGWLLWSGWRAWLYQRWLKRLAPMESLYQQMLTWLAEQGYRKRAADTPLEYAQQLHNHYPPSESQAIATISQAYVRWRYGGQPPNLPDLQQRLQTLKQAKRRLPRRDPRPTAGRV